MENLKNSGKTLIFRWLLITVAMLPFSVFAQEMSIQSFIVKWESALDYTRQVAEKMPAEYYNAGVKDMLDFRGQLTHALRNVQWLTDSYLDGGEFENIEMLRRDNLSKEELLQLLVELGEYSMRAIKDLETHEMKTEVDFFAGPMPVASVLHLLNDHMTHHRAQMVVFMRMKGVEAPRYKAW